MRITKIEWDENTIAHIARHGVLPQEAEEACFDNRPRIFKTKYNRYAALGQTGGGRYLAIIFEYLGGGKARIITARAMSEAERKLYKRR